MEFVLSTQNLSDHVYTIVSRHVWGSQEILFDVWQHVIDCVYPGEFDDHHCFSLSTRHVVYLIALATAREVKDRFSAKQMIQQRKGSGAWGWEKQTEKRDGESETGAGVHSSSNAKAKATTLGVE